MSEEIPIENRPLSVAEKAAVAKLSEADLQAIDAILLGQCCERWYKVARVVCRTDEALKNRYPDLSYVFYTQRLCHLVDEGRLDPQGNLLYMRFSEMRLPEQPSFGDVN